MAPHGIRQVGMGKNGAVIVHFVDPSQLSYERFLLFLSPRAQAFDDAVARIAQIHEAKTIGRMFNTIYPSQELPSDREGTP